MKYFLSIIISICSLSCGTTNNSDRLGAERVINNELKRQQECWNTANLECFMDGYWKSDSLQFIGSSGITYGWQKTLENYRKSYPNPATMGELQFEILSIESLGSSHFLATGKWELTRETDKPNGFFTLIWQKFGEDWKIIYDHSS
ncbi:MAG: nuclear transport factor 2 family protein [Flavobacteriales bacterium]|nr:nuclear transport factor 2 family protein [Flavobacteriales bacterium]